MIRIEILFDRQSTKNLKSGTLQALQNEIEQRLKPHYPEIWLRIDQGSAPQDARLGNTKANLLANQDLGGQRHPQSLRLQGKGLGDCAGTAIGLLVAAAAG